MLQDQASTRSASGVVARGMLRIAVAQRGRALGRTPCLRGYAYICSFDTACGGLASQPSSRFGVPVCVRNRASTRNRAARKSMKSAFNVLVGRTRGRGSPGPASEVSGTRGGGGRSPSRRRRRGATSWPGAPRPWCARSGRRTVPRRGGRRRPASPPARGVARRRLVGGRHRSHDSAGLTPRPRPGTEWSAGPPGGRRRGRRGPSAKARRGWRRRRRLSGSDGLPAPARRRGRRS